MADFQEILKKFDNQNQDYILNNVGSIDNYLKIIKYVFETNLKFHKDKNFFSNVVFFEKEEDWLHKKVKVYNMIFFFDEKYLHTYNKVIKKELIKIFEKHKNNFNKSFGSDVYLSFKVVSV